MSKLAPLKRLTDSYCFPGFSPKQIISGIFGDQEARVITYLRRAKKASVEPVERRHTPYTIASGDACVIFHQEIRASISTLKYGAWTAVSAVV